MSVEAPENVATEQQLSLSTAAARNLSTTTKTALNNPLLPLLPLPPFVVYPSSTSRTSFPFAVATRISATVLGHSWSLHPLFAVFIREF